MEKQKVKKIGNILICICLINLLSVSVVCGERGNISDENLDVIKNRLSQNLDKKISNLENFKIKVANAKIDEEDKELINSYTDGVIEGLEIYKQNIESATTVNEIIEYRKQANQFIIDNKENIKKAVRELTEALSDEILYKLAEILGKLQNELDELENMCSQASAEINNLRSDLDVLRQALEEMASLIEKDQNTLALIKAQSLSNEIQGMIENINNLYEKCKGIKE
ncbi:hypothetical protein KAT36_03090 [Candidatus Pacearchaeota archaeon]|nr:hypothetical protein [Candidatus Pacearchaeota archaeon]